MNKAWRAFFDEQLERVLPDLPSRVRAILDEVPLVVEDYPSREVMRKMGVRHRADLCGLYTGIPLTQRRIEQSGVPSDVVNLYREGILEMSCDEEGQVDEAELRKQIRITILHEIGHHHGLDEDELQELGY